MAAGWRFFIYLRMMEVCRVETRDCSIPTRPAISASQFFSIRFPTAPLGPTPSPRRAGRSQRYSIMIEAFCFGGMQSWRTVPPLSVSVCSAKTNSLLETLGLAKLASRLPARLGSSRPFRRLDDCGHDGSGD
jgi:hypothetical protein